MQAKPCKSLWVAGISQSVSKEELENEFLNFGKIQEFRFLRDRSTAYVDYVALEDATQALKTMNGKQIGGAHIRVDYLRSQSSKRVSYSATSCSCDSLRTFHNNHKSLSLLSTCHIWNVTSIESLSVMFIQSFTD